MNFRKQVDELIRDLEQADVLGGKAISSAKNAWKHRNDFHHLNPGYSDLDLETKAKECIDAVCSLENDIFGGKIIEGSLLPNHPEYWEIRDDGTVPVFVRNLDV